MATGTCDKAGCTVVETGICLLSKSDPKTCTHFHIASAQPPANTAGLLIPTVAARRFPPGLELGTADAAEIMMSRYAHVVGVLGYSNAGKTCFLLSLYMMASRGALPPNFRFAGSQTLQGFEARARRIRKWKGGALPDQLADHTTLSDPRQPAFLHLALRQSNGPRRRLDVMLTDLPGEWSKSLVDRAATADRFKFLRRADGIIVVVDGPVLESTSKHSELQRTKYLLERLAQSVGLNANTPLVLLVSKCDQINMTRPAIIDDLLEHAKSLGFSPDVVLSAAFSRIPQTVKNGVGIFEALEKTFAPDVRRAVPAHQAPPSERAFMNFGAL